VVRIAAVLVAMAGAAFWALGSEVEEAGACTGPPGYLTIMDADVILEGWVQSVVPSGSPDLTFAHHEVTFSVTRGYRGAADGESVVAMARIPIPGVPIMCPQFPPDLESKYVLLGLRADDSGAFHADAWDMLYISDAAPAGAGVAYARAVRLAELATDTNPDLPVVRVTPSAAFCGVPVTYDGARLPPGEYVLLNMERVVGTVNVTGEGTFTLTAPAIFHQCRNGEPMTFPGWIEVYPVTNSDPYVAALGALVELALLKVQSDGTIPILVPSLVISDRTPFVCGDEVIVAGDGFEAEPLSVRFEGSGGPVSVQVGPSPDTGSFEASIHIPEAACDASLAAISVYQSGFERFGRPLARIYIGTRQAPPGPPTVGNSPPPPPAPPPWLQLAGLAALILERRGWWRGAESLRAEDALRP
jgi:hypothetical protein